MKLKCQNKKCNHKWNYKGKQKFYCNCPKCMYKVNIKKAKIKVRKNQMEVSNK